MKFAVTPLFESAIFVFYKGERPKTAEDPLLPENQEVAYAKVIQSAIRDNIFYAKLKGEIRVSGRPKFGRIFRGGTPVGDFSVGYYGCEWPPSKISSYDFLMPFQIFEAGKPLEVDFSIFL